MRVVWAGTAYAVVTFLDDDAWSVDIVDASGRPFAGVGGYALRGDALRAFRSWAEAQGIEI